MLVYKLYKFFNLPKLKKELGVLEECRGFGDGIWDILGYYDPVKYEIVICDSLVEKHANALAKNKGFDEKTTKLVLRELVRLHEHGHSLLHTGKIGPLLRFKNGYKSVPPTINESVTEFIVWSTVKKFGTKLFEAVFDEVDKTTPPYYRYWKRIKQVIDRKKGRGAYLCYCPGIIYIVRKGTWKDFDSFLGEIEQEWETVVTIAVSEQMK